ncbi:hypothetical protein M8J76_017054 [Diaphorina citri]|nr:hypothetical protein M8J76_017054 [Diaphorina citri]
MKIVRSRILNQDKTGVILAAGLIDDMRIVIRLAVHGRRYQSTTAHMKNVGHVEGVASGFVAVAANVGIIFEHFDELVGLIPLDSAAVKNRI